MNKANFNGQQGEDRTRQIIGKAFIYNCKSVDFDGVDFEVELLPENSSIDIRDKIVVRGRVQAKFFEGKNEVEIAKEYVQDEEGIRTEFFALLHTDEEEKEVSYFFSALDISEKFRKRTNKRTGKEYYIFSLAKNRSFSLYKNVSKNEINRRIEEGIRNTEEYRNQRFIKTIEERFINPVQETFGNLNTELFEQIKGKHIVDKLFITLNSYNDFRRIISWRLVDKTSFENGKKTSTYYNQFSLITDNEEILSFFENIEVKTKVSVKNSSFFKGVIDVNHKINKIIDVLNHNLIVNVENSKKNIISGIRKNIDEPCDCLSCQYNRFDFNKAFNSLTNEKYVPEDLWECMYCAYVYFKFGKDEKAKVLFENISKKASHNKQEVIYFFAKYNLRIIAWNNFEREYPDLGIAISKLSVSNEKKVILESINNGTLFHDYLKSVDDIYLKIKEFKQRRVINNTSVLIDRLYAKIVEYFNFIDGNWLVINSYDAIGSMVEKVIESCIISYSMKTEHTNHLNSINDFIVKITVQYCEPNKLLGFFQRNYVKSIPYETTNNYFENSLANFFSKKNADFLYDEICYFENRTKNPDLRRRTVRIFENLCIFLAYLKTETCINGILKDITYFIHKLDFHVHDVSILAHPLFKKPNLFSTTEIICLVEVIISKEGLINGYILTNCLIALRKKEYIFKPSDGVMVDSICSLALTKRNYGLLKVLPSLLPIERMKKLKTQIVNSLSKDFNRELYFAAIINNCLAHTESFFDLYLSFYSNISTLKTNPSFFRNQSPYTGIGQPLRGELNNLVEVVFTINESNLLKKPTIQEIKKYHPYYKYLLSIEHSTSTEQFDVLWLLENQSELVLKTLSKNPELKNCIKENLLNSFNKELGRIFIRYFP